MLKKPTRTTRQARGVRWPRRLGFTLIELMVVVSIIAVLMAVLLPSLGQAREQARKVVCLSNLHQLANAVEAYVQDYNAYPLFLLRGNGNQVGMCSWAWGGKTTSIDPWQSYSNGIFYFQAKEKPLNRFLGAATFSEPEPITDDRDRSELKIFRCPSDNRSWQALWHTAKLTHRPAYEDVGTSYQLNWHWFEQATRASQSARKWIEFGQDLFTQRSMHGASRFLLLMEDSLDRGIASRIETLGLHRKWATHNVLMLDGHAQTLRVTLKDLDRFPYPFGAEWSAFDESVTGRSSSGRGSGGSRR